jgi:hypothetical protein
VEIAPHSRIGASVTHCHTVRRSGCTGQSRLSAEAW